MLLLLFTSVAVIAFFLRGPRGENAWHRIIAPAISVVLLTGIVILAARNYATLLGVRPGDNAAWALPASYAAVAVIGLGWGLILKARRPVVYAAIGLGPAAVTARLSAVAEDAGR